MLNKKAINHPFHLVHYSPMPYCTAWAAFTLMSGFVLYINDYADGYFLFTLGLKLLLVCIVFWLNAVINESVYGGFHTIPVQKGIRLGVGLFIVAEAMFFFPFFWAFFHAAISPTIWIGTVWPPLGIATIDPFKFPLFNTYILVLSGVSVTWSHYALCRGSYGQALMGLVNTLLPGLFFLFVQYIEYCNAGFTISDGIYGTTFYMTTGLHGLHVFMGVLGLFVCFLRLFIDNNFTKEHHIGFEASI
jgi:cytochrome c oxidase subunit 3